MPKPVILQPPSPRIVGQGIEFSFVPSATNSPGLWTVSGLPAGWTADPATGAISGKALASGETTVTLQAHVLDDNEEIEESSDPVSFVVVIMATPPGAGGPLEHLMDWELVTGEVGVPGVPAPAAGEGGEVPVLRLKRADRFPVLVGILRYGVLQDVGEEVALRLGFKEFEPERLIAITDASVERVGAAPDLTRYRIWLHLTEEAWSGELADYEGDAGTQVLALAELQLEAGSPTLLYSKTKESAPFPLQGGLGEDSYLPVSATLLFDDQLAYAAPYGFSLVLALQVTGRPGQSVQLARTLKVGWNAGASEWEVSGLAGPASVQGVAEGTQWRATLHNLSVSGGAGGVTVDCEITTSDDADVFVWDIDMAPHLTPGTNLTVDMPFTTNGAYLHLFDGVGAPAGAELIDQFNPEGPGTASYGSPSNLAIALQNAWTSMAYGASDAQIVGPATIRLMSPGAGSVRKAVVTTNVHADPSEAFPPASYPGQGVPRSAKLVGTLTQTELPPGGQIVRSSRTFRVAVDRDINPNTA